MYVVAVCGAMCFVRAHARFQEPVPHVFGVDLFSCVMLSLQRLAALLAGAFLAELNVEVSEEVVLVHRQAAVLNESEFVAEKEEVFENVLPEALQNGRRHVPDKRTDVQQHQTAGGLHGIVRLRAARTVPAPTGLLKELTRLERGCCDIY